MLHKIVLHYFDFSLGKPLYMSVVCTLFNHKTAAHVNKRMETAHIFNTYKHKTRRTNKVVIVPLFSPLTAGNFSKCENILMEFLKEIRKRETEKNEKEENDDEKERRRNEIKKTQNNKKRRYTRQLFQVGRNWIQFMQKMRKFSDVKLLLMPRHAKRNASARERINCCLFWILQLILWDSFRKYVFNCHLFRIERPNKKLTPSFCCCCCFIRVFCYLCFAIPRKQWM